MTQYVLYKEDANKYIGYSDTRKVIHVGKLENAYRFNTPNEARNARKKASKKMAYFHVYMLMDNGELEKVSANTPKRKSFTKEERIKIYKKTKGHCYLCGEFVDFDSFEIEHNIPLAKGGTNDFENLFCSCHCCNTMKNSIYPHELMEKVTQIFMYQMGKKYHNSIKWKMARRLLENLI